MGSLHPYRGSSYNSCCSLVQGGDCEAIEHYVFALFVECGGKITEKNWNKRRKSEKMWRVMAFLSMHGGFRYRIYAMPVIVITAMGMS